MKTGTLLRLCRVQLASRRTPNGYSLYVLQSGMPNTLEFKKHVSVRSFQNRVSELRKAERERLKKELVD